ncbi:hypothetical protein QFZ75_001404 [Streptomyces sp. V3I8]|uniref:hypothetical protein n=1 Tax=Streptomyces sp. V3I8 TaxID=3042279 RepID=UPI00277EF61D|nr:hypothetical protein [Streptomyces sp. V3I8]MDQ1034988.1 hypothetical protein [Streptomyces sp. V3I8]
MSTRSRTTRPLLAARGIPVFAPATAVHHAPPPGRPETALAAFTVITALAVVFVPPFSLTGPVLIPPRDAAARGRVRRLHDGRFRARPADRPRADARGGLARRRAGPTSGSARPRRPRPHGPNP